MTDQQAILAEIILSVLYLANIVYWVWKGNTAQKMSSIACSLGALFYFQIEALIYPPTFIPSTAAWFHVVMTATCLLWSWSVARFSDAVFVSISIVPLAILNIMMIFNYMIYGEAMTGMITSFSYLAIGIHLTILLIANITNGIALNNGAKRTHNVDMEAL